MEEPMLAHETNGAVIITLLPFNSRDLTEKEMAIIEFVTSWFWVDITLPTPEDIAHELNSHSLQAAKNALLEIRDKTNLLHSYQIPFLRSNGEAIKSVPLIDVAAAHQIAPHYQTEQRKRKAVLNVRERRVIQFFKKHFFEKLAVPSWKEAADHLETSERCAKNVFTQIRCKAGLSRGYQLPFVRL